MIRPVEEALAERLEEVDRDPTCLRQDRIRPQTDSGGRVRQAIAKADMLEGYASDLAEAPPQGSETFSPSSWRWSPMNGTGCLKRQPTGGDSLCAVKGMEPQVPSPPVDDHAVGLTAVTAGRRS